MNRAELLSRFAIATLVTVAIGAPVAAWSSHSLIHARSADSGGWDPGTLRAQVGQPLHLRLTSDDVMHGFAVGHLDMPAVDVLPGQVSDVTLLFEQPGTYTFYCTRWCGLNHWRMRGTIEVTGAASEFVPSQPPLYVSLGIDLDAPRTLTYAPALRPVAGPVPPKLTFLASYWSNAYYRSHSPQAVWEDLRAEPSSVGMTDRAVWDGVAVIWRSQADAAALARGAGLFAQNCAACHGEHGAGDGVFAAQLAASGPSSTDAAVAGAMSFQRPADFTDPSRLLSASPALLQGKILRGGMGTGMPSWGPLLTDQQTWDLVAYLYTFQFTYP